MEIDISNDTGLKKAQDEVLRKIGRNVLMFQQVEGLLKYLVANGYFAGHSSNMVTKRNQQIGEIKRKSMGQLVREFIDTTLTDQEPRDNNSDQNATEPFFSFSFKVSITGDMLEAKRKILADLVTERNNLFHHFLEQYKPETIESCFRMEELLDQQRKKILSEIDYLRSLVDSLQGMKTKLASFMNSDKGTRFLSEGILPHETRLVGLLNIIAGTCQREDGWTPLAVAGKVFKQQSPEHLSEIFSEYGTKPLKQLIEASDEFELLQEGTQWLYRSRHHP